MIFISYRREDTKAEVTNLHRRLVERYAEEQVFVDYNDIPPGEKWPDTLQGLRTSLGCLSALGKERLASFVQSNWPRIGHLLYHRLPG
jgi:TIR domain-containing protein